VSAQIRIARTQTYLVVRKNGVEPHLAFSLFSVPTNGKITLPAASCEIQAATLILREEPATVGTTIFRHAGSGPDLGFFTRRGRALIRRLNDGNCRNYLIRESTRADPSIFGLAAQVERERLQPDASAEPFRGDGHGQIRGNEMHRVAKPIQFSRVRGFPKNSVSI
jgi:hypothetical protein